MLHLLTTPTRFGLGEGRAWEEFETLCLIPQGLRLSSCKIHNVKENPVPKLTAADKFVILGEEALACCLPSLAIDKFRGTLLPLGAATGTATFHPQEAFDIKQQEDDSDVPQAFSNDKDGAATRPSNYFFWIRADIKKYLTKPRIKYPEFKYFVGPEINRLTAWLDKFINGGHTVYLDIETDIADNNLRCIGLAIDDSPVIVIPFYQHDNTTFYHNLYHRILARISLVLSRNRVVVHNSLFDLFILSRYYRVLCGHDIFDTMYVQHRLFPEAEKSLGHAISYWTWLPYHKDLNPGRVFTREQETALWKYNALDVYAMREVYKEQVKYLALYDDCRGSADLANAECYPYLTCQLLGTPVNEERLLFLRSNKHRRVKQLLRICRILSGIPTFNPGSPQQCVSFFHTKLGYDVVGRTKTGQPKMDTKCLYKLRLKYPNPLLDAIIAYRVDAKTNSMLNFTNYERPTY